MKEAKAMRTPRHIYSVKFNMQTFLVIVDKPDPAVAIGKATKIALRDLAVPGFRYCEYIGTEDR